MTWWKVSYDFRRPFWAAFGRVAYLKAETFDDAHARAVTFTAHAAPGADITRLDVTPSSFSERLRFWRRVQASWLWKRNAASGIPNDRKSL